MLLASYRQPLVHCKLSTLTKSFPKSALFTLFPQLTVFGTKHPANAAQLGTHVVQDMSLARRNGIVNELVLV